MTTPDFFFQILSYTATGAVLLLFFTIIFAFVRMRKINTILGSRITLLESEYEALRNVSRSFSSRITSMNASLRSLSDCASAEPFESFVERPYERAIRLAQEGASSDEISARCNLSKQESTLIIRLHGQISAPVHL